MTSWTTILSALRRVMCQSSVVEVSRAVANTGLLLSLARVYQRCTMVHVRCQHPLLHCRRSKADADDVAADLSVPVERLVYRLV